MQGWQGTTYLASHIHGVRKTGKQEKVNNGINHGHVRISMDHHDHGYHGYRVDSTALVAKGGASGSLCRIGQSTRLAIRDLHVNADGNVHQQLCLYAGMATWDL